PTPPASALFPYTTLFRSGGELSNNKGINKQGGGLTAPALTAKDMEDIRTAMSFQCDYLAVSFPKSATDMELARQLANVAGEPWRDRKSTRLNSSHVKISY